MGLMEWLRNKLKVTQVYEIKATPIKIPEDGEMLIFEMPKDVSPIVIDEFEKRLVELQNMERKFLVVNCHIEVVKAKKTTRKEAKLNESNINIGNQKVKKQR